MSLLETFTCVPVAATTIAITLILIVRGRVDRRVGWLVAIVGVGPRR